MIYPAVLPIAAKANSQTPITPIHFINECDIFSLDSHPIANTVYQPKTCVVASLLTRVSRSCVMKQAFLACVSALALGGSVSAADLPRPLAKAPLYPPFYNWTGFYLGINGGGAWGTSEWDSTASSTSRADFSAAPPATTGKRAHGSSASKATSTGPASRAIRRSPARSVARPAIRGSQRCAAASATPPTSSCRT